MEETEKIKVLLVDDHPITLQGLRSFLLTQSGIEVVGQASNGKEAVAKALALDPAVVIMDLTMPVMGGLEATRQLRTRAPEVAVLILTAHEVREFRSQIIDAGARGYMSKSAPPAELLRGIAAIYRGESFFSSSVTEVLVKDDIEATGEMTLKGQVLSNRELEVVRLITEGFSNKQAAHVLSISARTVEKHRQHIMTKLNLESVVDLTKYAIAHDMIDLDLVEAVASAS